MKRKALFVGVNEYEDPQIRNLNYSVGDAHALKTMFEQLGYQSDILENPSKSDVFRAVRQMTADLSAGDLFFFYFAGHGWTTTTGKHLLFCTDDQYEDLRYDYNVGIPFGILKKRTESGGYDRAFVLDACRSDFITGTRGGDETTRDLQPIGELVKDAPTKSSLAVLRSCSKYEHALEIEARKHGLFTLAMMDVLNSSREAGTELLFGESLCDAVTQKMSAIARAEGIVVAQTPEFAKSGIAQVLICGRKASQSASPSGAALTLVVCPACGKKNHPENTFRCRECRRDNLCLRHQDEATFLCAKCAAVQRKAREEAERKAREEKKKKQTRKEKKPTREETGGQARKETGRKAGTLKKIFLPGGEELRLRWCPAGTFMMGSPESEEGRDEDETRHRVTLSKGFWLGETPVTRKQWKSVMEGGSVSRKIWDRFKLWTYDECPVGQVTWKDCQTFVKKLNGELDCGARLPTEAEWEYACRAGTRGKYAGTGELDDMGWYDENSKGKISPVGEKKSNAWGLCDMHGNVFEWCEDWYGDYPLGSVKDPQGPDSGTRRVLRGGCCDQDASTCRSAYRNSTTPGYRSDLCGFRLCCSAGPRD